MNVPDHLKYSKDHEWIRVEGDEAYVGITDFAQSQLGDIVFVDVTTVGETLAQNDAVSVTLFAFDKGEEISTHESGGDVLVLCLDGEGRITVDGVEHILHEGESILMPARHPHAVFGQERFKMLLVVVF